MDTDAARVLLGGGMNRPSTVWINGRLEPAERALLTVTDRGFQVGDGIFETIRVVGGRVLELPTHVSRLQTSAAVLAMPLPDDLERCLGLAIADLCIANGLDGSDTQVAVRVTVSRGAVEGRALLPPHDVRPNIVVQAWRVDPPPAELLSRGLHLAISEVRRDPASPLATVKTTSRAEFVYAQIEARRRGADDALFLTYDGHLAEATSASLFLVEGVGLTTPSLDCGIVVSTTRSWVISSGGPGLGLAVRQDHLTPNDLYGADEAFVASSVAGILPVTIVNGRPIGAGTPGVWTLRLRTLRENEASDSSTTP
jgi:branched-subunit amino acid aminotransferase/4-amino-4-deoxychorismate lyase